MHFDVAKHHCPSSGLDEVIKIVDACDVEKIVDLDGVVPLTFLPDDPALKAKVVKYMDLIITRQDETGWIAPSDDQASYDLWAI